MSLTIIVGQPGSGKSKAIRDRYLRTKSAVFLDGHHSAEAVRQIRHEMGYFEHRYLSCKPENLWPELARLHDEREVYIDMPDLPENDLRLLQQLAEANNLHLTVTARAVPHDLQNAEVINL
ncbi:MAG: hypothetical protein ACM3XS_10055 [Bacteroidota bacterium]